MRKLENASICVFNHPQSLLFKEGSFFLEGVIFLFFFRFPKIPLLKKEGLGVVDFKALNRIGGNYFHYLI